MESNSGTANRDPTEFPLPRSVVQKAQQVAGLAAPLLITGETGTGKTRLARQIHDWGLRATEPFVRVDCAAITTSLAESELFGHERGAFTGATTSHTGLIPSAEAGTLFFDEISVLPPELQCRLLSVLEEREVRPVGSTRTRTVEARPICATNEDLLELMDQGLFRRDLYYRCCTFHIQLPALRERSDDIAPIAQYLLVDILNDQKVIPYLHEATLAPETMRLHRAYDWPGNIRELRHVLVRALVAAGAGRIEPQHLPPAVREFVRSSNDISPEAPKRRGERYEAPADHEYERRLILEALADANGNRSEACRRLGMSRTTLYERIHRYSIEEDEWSLGGRAVGDR